jgi:hypothetical protein
VSDFKQYTGRRTSAQEHLLRALTSGTAVQEGERRFWMPGFVPIEYLRAENRRRLGVTEDDPVFAPRKTKEHARGATHTDQSKTGGVA